MAKLSAMKFTEWLSQETGRATRVADHFGITLSAVSQWGDDGIPKDRMKEVCDFTGNEVALEDMLPSTPKKALA